MSTCVAEVREGQGWVDLAWDQQNLYWVQYYCGCSAATAGTTQIKSTTSARCDIKQASLFATCSSTLPTSKTKVELEVIAICSYVQLNLNRHRYSWATGRDISVQSTAFCPVHAVPHVILTCPKARQGS
jgi:hypothetical protein